MIHLRISVQHSLECCQSQEILQTQLEAGSLVIMPV